jgi:hypothetical protein
MESARVAGDESLDAFYGDVDDLDPVGLSRLDRLDR